MAPAHQHNLGPTPAESQTTSPSLLPAPSADRSDSLPLRKYTSSSASVTTTTTTTSPALPHGFEGSSGSLAKSSSGAPARAPQETFNFRPFSVDEDLSYTPIELSPVTPRSPGELANGPRSLTSVTPPSSCSQDSQRFNLAAGSDSLLAIKVPRKSYETDRVYQAPAGISNPNSSGYEATAAQTGPSPVPSYPAVPRSEHPQATDAEYIKFINSEYERLTQKGSATPPATHSRQRSQSASVPRQASPASIPIVNDVDRAPSRTSNLSPSQSRRDSPQQHSVSPKLGAGWPAPASMVAHGRNLSLESAGRSQRSPNFDFAAAKEAREQDRLALSNMQSANQATKAQTQSPTPPQVPPSPPKQMLVSSSETEVSERPKMLPTPVKPILSRFGSRLKADLMGAFAKKDDARKERKPRPPTPEEEVERVNGAHWTELE